MRRSESDGCTQGHTAVAVAVAVAVAAVVAVAVVVVVVVAGSAAAWSNWTSSPRSPLHHRRP